ncbi:unnamed protein product [Cylicocyclus nassatus]|uniref:Uncharacterized protein n=1 Tax=Cylicocyclus nassatus TaxID=53992 RepID=A0AA36M1F8_CYLNA|nr:unnamed protein product [Cylicocyclus nassatus]
MRYVSSYLLALAGGNEHAKLEHLDILGAVGVDTAVEAAKLVISHPEGKSIGEVIAKDRLVWFRLSGWMREMVGADMSMDSKPKSFLQRILLIRLLTRSRIMR